MNGLINCMAHNAVCVFNTLYSVVTRCSEDYKTGDVKRARRHLHNSYANMPWLGQTAWGDHDMFHSSDAVCGRIMAVSKAMSGGPVYLSDAPDAIAVENVLPLCYADGELLRPLAPAAPLPESMFLDPFAQARPFRAVAPLPGGAAAVAVYNLTEPEQPVLGWVGPEDYAQAAAMLQPPDTCTLPPEGLVYHDWYSRETGLLDRPWRFGMPAFCDRLVLLCPVKHGWAVIGRPDKFLSPCTVECLESSRTRLVLRMREPGPFRFWKQDGRPVCRTAKVQTVSTHTWEAVPLEQDKDRIFEFTVQDRRRP